MRPGPAFLGLALPATPGGGSAVTVPLRPGQVLALAIAPDDQTALTATADARLVHRRLATGEESTAVKLGWTNRMPSSG